MCAFYDRPSNVICFKHIQHCTPTYYLSTCNEMNNRVFELTLYLHRLVLLVKHNNSTQTPNIRIIKYECSKNIKYRKTNVK